MGQDIAGACGQLVVDTQKAGAVVDTAAPVSRSTDIEDCGTVASVSAGAASSACSAAPPSSRAVSDVTKARADAQSFSVGDGPWLRVATIGFLVFLLRLASLVAIGTAAEL